ncbi:MAG TPA: MFS transporter [Lacisediminihabitans sp.]|uniref:MFS transporter n=1 Tax=Lacisediminihabitans sp. TaxID=2787631 RepID=UPI002EDB6F93
MPTLSNRSSFWTAAAVVAVALWASGAPSMVYPVYVAEWQLPPIVITSIFAVYPISLVVILVIFGSISDYIGRRATMLAGVTAMAIGILLFAIAPNVGWLFAGRIFQGIGVGLAMSPASAAMVEFNPGGNAARASSINTAATAVGLALATIVGGALVQFAPLPGHLAYWVLFALTLALIVAILFMPRRVVGTTAEGRWRPRGVRVPKGLGGVFITSALAVTAGFAMGALLLSLGSEIAKDLINTENAFVAGSIIALSAVAIGVTAVVARPLAPRTAIGIGGLTTAAGMGLIALAAATASLPVFLSAQVVAGVGYGLLFLGGLGLTNRHAPAHHRAQTLSAVYLVAYLAQGLIAVSLGLSATSIGLAPAVDIWAPVIAGICIAAALLAALVGRRRAAVVA